MDVDALIEEAVAVGHLQNGGAVSLLAQNGNGAALRLAAIHGSANGRSNSSYENLWTPEEEARLADLLRQYPVEVIAQKLGRTRTAVYVHMKRLRLPGPSKQPGEWTATAVARRMGMCGKTIAELIDRGILSGRVASTTRNIRVVKIVTFKRWLVNPLNWIYFKFERIRDPQLKRLVAHQRARWDDEWWSTGRVAAYHGLKDSCLVQKYISEGKIPAVRWANWWVLRSDAMNAEFTRGKGSNPLRVWSYEADKFMVLASAMGVSVRTIGEMTGYGEKRARARLRHLEQRGHYPRMALAAGVVYDDGRLWADWREYTDRFPGVVLMMQRFREGRPLSEIDRSNLRGILRAWALRYGQGVPELEELAGRLRWSQNAQDKKLREGYEVLVAHGIDVLEVDDVEFDREN